MLNRDGPDAAFEDRCQEFFNFFLRSDARRYIPRLPATGHKIFVRPHEFFRHPVREYCELVSVRKIRRQVSGILSDPTARVPSRHETYSGRRGAGLREENGVG